MILRKPSCQRLTQRKRVGAIFLGLLLLSVAPEWTEAQSLGQPAAAASDQELRDLERRIQKLETRMDQAWRALRHRGGHGPDTLFTTVRASRPLDQSVHSLRMDTNIGNIQVTRADGAEITVEAIVRVDKTWLDPEKTGKEFDQHVRMAQTGDILTIADAHKDAPDHAAWAVALNVAIPRALPLTAGTGVGDVEIELASGAVSLSTGAGNATLKADSLVSVAVSTGAGDATLRLGKVTEKVEAQTGAGSVSVELFNPGSHADVTLTTNAGSLVLKLPPGPIGKFDLEAGMGSISVEGLQGVQVKKNGMGASALAQVGEQGPHYKLHTGVGSITTSVRK